MPFSHPRTIRFADTDAAGVVYFAQIFSICHEAYEASLAAQGINLPEFFRDPTIAVPIVHAEADFRRPLACGDQIIITLQPQQLSPHSYKIKYDIYKEYPEPDLEPDLKPQFQPQLIAQAQTRHICVDFTSKVRQELPPALRRWLVVEK